MEQKTKDPAVVNHLCVVTLKGVVTGNIASKNRYVLEVTLKKIVSTEVSLRNASTWGTIVQEINRAAKDLALEEHVN